MAVRRAATIGVYGYSAGTFLAALREADVALLLDVRQRRGVRGPQYAWAACYRSLIADRLATRHGVSLVHLRPASRGERGGAGNHVARQQLGSERLRQRLG